MSFSIEVTLLVFAAYLHMVFVICLCGWIREVLAFVRCRAGEPDPTGTAAPATERGTDPSCGKPMAGADSAASASTLWWASPQRLRTALIAGWALLLLELTYLFCPRPLDVADVKGDVAICSFVAVLAVILATWRYHVLAKCLRCRT